jgi:hypothetical protein
MTFLFLFLFLFFLGGTQTKTGVDPREKGPLRIGADDERALPRPQISDSRGPSG